MLTSKLTAAVVGMVVALAAAAVQADNIAVQDPLFSQPLVSLEQQASPFLFGTGWTAVGPASSLLEVAPGVFVNTGTIVFQNTPAGQVNSIDNLTADLSITEASLPPGANTPGNGTYNLPYLSAAAIAAETGNEFSQVLATNFESGKTYSLTVGVGHNFGNAQQIPAANAELRLELYYTDGSNQRQPVAVTDIFNDAGAGLGATHLLDFTATSALLAENDPAVGQPIGVLLTTIGPAGGYFDMQNVRVAAVPEPGSMGLLAGAALLLLRRRRRVNAAA